ncbi:unnamed protein product [Lota lota]
MFLPLFLCFWCVCMCAVCSDCLQQCRGAVPMNLLASNYAHRPWTKGAVGGVTHTDTHTPNCPPEPSHWCHYLHLSSSPSLQVIRDEASRTSTQGRRKKQQKSKRHLKVANKIACLVLVLRLCAVVYKWVAGMFFPSINFYQMIIKT